MSGAFRQFRIVVNTGVEVPLTLYFYTNGLLSERVLFYVIVLK